MRRNASTSTATRLWRRASSSSRTRPHAGQPHGVRQPRRWRGGTSSRGDTAWLAESIDRRQGPPKFATWIMGSDRGAQAAAAIARRGAGERSRDRDHARARLGTDERCCSRRASSPAASSSQGANECSRGIGVALRRAVNPFEWKTRLSCFSRKCARALRQLGAMARSCDGSGDGRTSGNRTTSGRTPDGSRPATVCDHTLARIVKALFIEAPGFNAGPRKLPGDDRL